MRKAGNVHIGCYLLFLINTIPIYALNNILKLSFCEQYTQNKTLIIKQNIKFNSIYIFFALTETINS